MSSERGRLPWGHTAMHSRTRHLDSRLSALPSLLLALETRCLLEERRGKERGLVGSVEIRGRGEEEEGRPGQARLWLPGVGVRRGQGVPSLQAPLPPSPGPHGLSFVDVNYLRGWCFACF